MKSKKKAVIVGIILLVLGVGWYIATKPRAIEGYVLEPTEADTLVVTVPNESGDMVDVDVSDWKIYRNDELGFSFRFPAYYKMKTNAGGRDSLLFNFGLYDTRPNAVNKDVGGLFQGMTGLVYLKFSKSANELKTDYESGKLQSIEYQLTTSDNQSFTVWEDLEYTDMRWFFFTDEKFEIEIEDGSSQSLSEFLAIIKTFSRN